LHAIFQRHHIPPHEVYNLPPNEKRFIYASMILQLEEESKENEKHNKKKKVNMSMEEMSEAMNRQNK
jgi:hypothetical protein